MSIIKPSSIDTKTDTVQDVLDILQEGDSKIIYSTKKDVILILGTTGSGKSTFTQFIAGYDDDLISEELKSNPGEFIIKDKNDKISNDTFTSKTIFPNLVLDTKTEAVYYDCPGFSDTRSPAHDIAVSYFIKKVISHAKRVKLVFTADYNSVRQGGDRQAFLVLVDNAVAMIKNINKFDHSIALIVTKVDNNYMATEENEDGDVIPTLIADKFIINSIAEFLDKLIDYIQTKDSHKEIDSINAKRIEFINALLHKKGENYANIGIFRRPDKSGRLSKIKLLQSRKPSMKKIIHENIQFITYEKKDFGYTTSLASNYHLLDLITKINENIVTNFVKIGQEIEKYYHSQEMSSRDIQVLSNKFSSGYNSLSAVKISALSTLITEPQQLLKMIANSIIDLNISISTEHFQSIINHGEYLKFIKTIDGELSVMKPAAWVHALTTLLDYLDSSKKWYLFLDTFYNFLSEYHVQRNYRQYASILDNLKYKITINENNQEIVLDQLKQFLGKMSKEGRKIEYESIENVRLNKSKLKILMDLLDLTLKYDVDFSCERNDNNLIIKGQYIRLQDIYKSPARCKQAKSIEIFALNKVFIDTSFNKTADQVQLSIIAPTWEIIEKQSIILNGSPGISLKPEKAKNAIAPGAKGDDGKPGEPGGPAGHFLSIAQHVINGKNLNISIVGGKGGPGQHGGDGKKGEDGKIPKVPKDRDEPSWGAGFSVDEHVENKLFSLTTFMYGAPVTGVKHSGQWWVRGQNCTRGGNGGNGGAGGRGGNSIDAVIINLQEDSKFLITANNGASGISGIGGRGGEAANVMGELLILEGVSRKSITVGNSNPSPEYEYKVISQKKLRPCETGNRGNDGYNNKNMTEPKKVVLSLLPAVVINDYKTFVRDNLSNSIIELHLRKFQDDLEHHNSVRILYDVFGFVNELQGLENQFYRLRKKLPLSPFYESLLYRIAQYTNKLYENNELTDENKKVLGYLYTAILSKIYSINNNSGNDLVLDLPKHLEITVEEIKRLKDLGNVASINEEQTKYQKVLAQKINEATNFVESQINPEITNVFYEIDHQIELLINETVALQNATQAEKQKLEEQQGKLENTLALKKMFGVLKMGSQFLSFLGPVGKAAGTVIGAGLMVTESLALRDSSSEIGLETIAALPAAMKDALPKITEQLKQQQELFKEQLADSQRELKDFLDKQPAGDMKDIRDIEKKIAETNNKLEKEMAQAHSLNPASVDTMYNMRKEVADLLQKKIGILEILTPREALKTDKRLKIVQRIENIVSAVEIPLDFYKTIKNDQVKLNTLRVSIKKAYEKLDQLMLYEESIYKSIIPICKGIQNKVNEMESNLQGKSHAALDISKWQIQSTLRDMKLTLQKMTKESKIQEELTRCIEKLEEGMTVMIKMYDRIENYHDKAELVDYIANINSNRANAISIGNEVLRSKVDNLKLIIQSNLVLEKYEKGMNAFKQHIYPFSAYFLPEFDLPSWLQSNDTNSLVEISAEKITVLRNKLIESQITVTKYDKLIHGGVFFNGTGTLSLPFFVWKSNKHKNVIKDLLEGKEITIKSDIKQSLHKNAVKFNTIGIHFKAINETLQNELDKRLQGFEVEMIHMGTSYYRCDSKFYTISSDNQTISYTFAKKDNGEPIDSNDVYKKLQKYAPMLSPYTWWKIKISQYGIGKNVILNPLEKYKNEEIDLELVGMGQYVAQDINECNGDLNKYYAADVISDIDNIDFSTRQLLPEIPMIDSHNSLTKSNTKYINRKRRSVDKHEMEGEVNTNSFATSGACSNMKSSFINDIFNLIGSGLMAYKYLSPLNKIGQWFRKDDKHNRINEDFIALNADIPQIINWANTQFSDSELPGVSNLFINHESSTVNSLPNALMFCNNGNLLLLDLIIRRKNGIKYQQKDLIVDQKLASEFAQNLAYHASAPRI